MQKYTIDATNKKLGRVASEAASVLMGKNTPSFRRNAISGNSVCIKNVSKIFITAKKLSGMEHVSYTGYPGGLRKRSAVLVVKKKGYRELFRHAIYGMLPKNKLRSLMIKRLTIMD